LLLLKDWSKQLYYIRISKEVLDQHFFVLGLEMIESNRLWLEIIFVFKGPGIIN
jgi:hypothetical protein